MSPCRRCASTLRRTAFAHGCHVLTEKPMASKPCRGAGNHQVVARVPSACTPSCRTAATLPMCAASGGFSTVAFWASRPASTATSSSHRILAVSARRWTMCCCSTWRSILLMRRATWSTRKPRTSSAGNGNRQEAGIATAPARWRSSTLANGAVFTYRGSWCANGFKTSWESTWRIVCERGSLIWDGFDDIRAEVDSAGPRWPVRSSCSPSPCPPLDQRDAVGGHLGVIKDFVKAIETNTEPETRGSDNIKSLAMVFGAIESSERAAP